MLEIVHDEKSPILQVPGSVTYGCVMGGMALLALWRCAVGLAARGSRRRAPHGARRRADVPQAHW